MSVQWETKAGPWKSCDSYASRSFNDATGQRITARVQPDLDFGHDWRVMFYEAGLARLIAMGSVVDSLAEGQALVDEYLAKVTA